MNPKFRGHEPLMMFYLLPEEIVARTELTDFPRDPHLVLDDPGWRNVYESDYFQLVLTDTWAWLVWEYLGVRGGMEQYSAYDPFWMLAHAYSLWMKVFMAMGLTAERYFNIEPGDTLRHLPHEEVADLTRLMVNYYISNSDFRALREVVHTHRTHEDYDSRRSSVKIDFYRHWYHSRSKVKIVDMVQADEGGFGYDHSDRIDSRLDLERFTEGLDGKNQRIVKLLLAGYTQAEIARRIGFANHSGINKRIKRIGAMLTEYMKP